MESQTHPMWRKSCTKRGLQQVAGVCVCVCVWAAQEQVHPEDLDTLAPTVENELLQPHTLAHALATLRPPPGCLPATPWTLAARGWLIHPAAGYLARAAAAWTAPGTEVTRKWDSWFSLVNRRPGAPEPVSDWWLQLPVKLIFLDNRGKLGAAETLSSKISRRSPSPRPRGSYPTK